MMRRGSVTEEALTSEQYAHDPRVLLLRHDCPRCFAVRGHYCRTSGGWQTLHKARLPKAVAA